MLESRYARFAVYVALIASVPCILGGSLAHDVGYFEPWFTGAHNGYVDDEYEFSGLNGRITYLTPDSCENNNTGSNLWCYTDLQKDCPAEEGEVTVTAETWADEIGYLSTPEKVECTDGGEA